MSIDPVKVLVVGCQKDSSNFGVQMLAAGTQSFLLDVFPNTQVTYLDEYLSGTKKHRTNFFQSIRKYKTTFLLSREHDIVYLVNGGDSFSDQYGLRRFFSVFLYFVTAKLSKTFSIMAPQTIGPFSNVFARKLSKMSWIYPSLNFVRDKQSFEYLELIGLNHLEKTPDIAFNHDSSYLPVVEKEYDFCLNVSGLLWNENEIVDCLVYQETIVKVIDFILSKGKRLVITPHVLGGVKKDNDLEAIFELKSRYSKDINFFEPETPEDVAICLRKSKFAIGSRLHFCINSLRNNLNVIALSYSPKFQGVLSDYSGASVFEISSLAENFEDLMVKLNILNEKIDLDRIEVDFPSKYINQFDSMRENILKNLANFNSNSK
jgi:polysaccharide pyruvyl transferase WcaK-like protein